MEKEWRSLKYSVNSEGNSKNNEDTINNDVIIKQLATRKKRKQDDDTKISKIQHERRPPQCQLTANKTDSNNLKEASKNSAKQGKSIIPAHRRLLSISLYGSLNKIDSTKELGPLDNTYKNRIAKTRTYANVNLINTNIYTKTPTSIKKYPTTTSEPRYTPKSRIEYKLNPTEIKGQCKGHHATLQIKIMAPKTIWIQSLNTSAEPELKMAPKFKFMWIFLLAEPKLNLAPKNLWITTSVGSALAPPKCEQAPKIFRFTTSQSNQKLRQLQVGSITSQLDLKLRQKLTWIRNFAVKITIKQEIAPNISWIHNFTVRIEIPPKNTWILNFVVKINRAIPTLILLHIELTTARIKPGSNSLMNCYNIKPKDVMTHNFTVKLGTTPNRNWIHNLTLKLEAMQKITWIHNCATNYNLVNLTLILLHIESLTARTKSESNILLKHYSISQDNNHCTTIASPLISTQLLIQPFISFMVNPHLVNIWKNHGGTGEHDNVATQTQLKDLGQRMKPEKLEHTELLGRHPQHPQHQHGLMNAASITNNLDMTEANHYHECNQGRKRRREASMSMPNQEDKKKIIFKIEIDTCNISYCQCNMFVDSRSRTQASENEIKYRLQVEDKGRGKEHTSSMNSIKSQSHNIPPCVEGTTFHFMWKAYYSTSCGKLMSTFSTHLVWEETSVSILIIKTTFIKKIHYLKTTSRI